MVSKMDEIFLLFGWENKRSTVGTPILERPVTHSFVRLAVTVLIAVIGRGGGGRVYSIFMHGRTRLTIAIRPSHTYTYNARTEHVGFSPTRQALLAPSAKRREVFAESHEG